MSPLPIGWEETKIGEIARIETGRTPAKSNASYYAREVCFYKPGDLDAGGVVSQSEDMVSKAGAAAGRLLPPQTLLITCIGNLGKTALTGSSSICNQQINAVLPTPAAEPKYLYYWSRTIRPWLEENSSATTVSIINKSRFSVAPIRIAPLPEQRRIVAKIDNLSANSKRARDNLDHIPRLAEKYKQAILAAAFRGELTREWRGHQSDIENADKLVERTEVPTQSRGGREATTNVKPGTAGLSVNNPRTEVPDGWAWVSLRRIARQETGHTPSRSHPEYWDGGIPWIGIVDAGNHHGQIIYDTLQTVSEEGLANSSARLLPAGTVCLSRTASVGYVTIMGRPMATSQDFATWTCTPALVSKYLMFALMAEGESIREFGEGSTHTTIYFPEIRALHICLAPLAEQHEVVRCIEKAFTWIDRLALETTSARKLIDHLDQAILAKAFQGELVPQDPNDEPASVLLERIKQERAIAVPSRHDAEKVKKIVAKIPRKVHRRKRRTKKRGR